MKKVSVIIVGVIILLSVLLGVMMFKVGSTDDTDTILTSYSNMENHIRRPISVEEVQRQVDTINDENSNGTSNSSTGGSGSNPSPPGVTTPVPSGVPTNWLDIVDKCHKWYGKNGLTYVRGGTADIKDLNGNSVTVRKDCSGYVGFCFYTANLANAPICCNSSSIKNLSFVKPVSQTDLQVGDLLVYNGHVEVYAGNDRVWNWGSSKSAQDKYTGVTDFNKVDSTINWSRKNKEHWDVYRIDATKLNGSTP